MLHTVRRIALLLMLLVPAACGDDASDGGPTGRDASDDGGSSAGSGSGRGGSSGKGGAGASGRGGSGGSAGNAGSGAMDSGPEDAGPDVDAQPDHDATIDPDSAVDAGATDAPQRIAITPAGAILRRGESAVFTAKVLDANGDARANPVTWLASGTAVAIEALAGNQVRVTAGSAIDSAQLTASVAALQSAPVTIAVAEPVAGARLLDDDEVLGDAKPISDLQTGALGSQLHALIAEPAPSVGDILLGRGKAIAGRVISSTPATGGHEVVFETVALDELFAEINIEQTYDLRNVAPSFREATPTNTTVAANGDVTYHFMADVPDYAPPARLYSFASNEFKLGPFYCAVKTGIAPSLSASQIAFSITPNVQWSVSLSVGAGSAAFRVLGQGAIDAVMHGPLRLNSNFTGSMSCQAPFIEQPILLPPPLALLVTPAFVGGARLAVDGTVTLNTMELMIDATASQPIQLGVEVKSNGTVSNLSSLDVSQLDYELKPELRNTTLNSPVRVEAHFGGGLYAQAAFTNPIFYAYRRFNDQYPYLSMLDLQSGLRAELLVATIADQANDPASEAGYNVKFATRFGLGADATDVIAHVSRLLSFGAGLVPDFTHEKLLFSHPLGAAIAYLDAYQQGDHVRFHVELLKDFVAPELLGYYNVRRIEIWRRDGQGGAELLIGRDALDGEETFDFEWPADRGGACNDNVFAFVEPVFGEGFSFELGPVRGWSDIQQIGAGNDQQARAVAIDADGRVAIAGYTLDGIAGMSSAGGADALWLMLNPIATLTYGKLFGGSGDDIPRDMQLGPDGHYYVTGYSAGGDFAGTGAPGTLYPWLAKLDGQGNVAWKKSWLTPIQRNGDVQETANSLAFGPSGEIYVASTAGTGLYGPNALSLSCPDGVGENAASDCGDVVVTVFDAHGVLVGHTVDARKGWQLGVKVAADAAGNVTVVANTFGDIDADEVPGNEDDALPISDPARFKLGIGIWKLDSGSREFFSRRYLKIDKKSLSAGGVAADDAGNAVIAGNTDGSFSGLNLGGRDAFVMSVGPTGGDNWTQMLATAGDDLAGAVRFAGGEVLVAGVTTGMLAAMPAGGNDAFVARFSTAGAELWKAQFGGLGQDVPLDLARDRFGNVFVVGSTSGKLNSALTTQGLGGTDMFVAKYGPGGLTPQ